MENLPPVVTPVEEIPEPVEVIPEISEDQGSSAPPVPEAFPPDWKKEPESEPDPEPGQFIQKSEQITLDRGESLILEEDATYLVTIIIKNRGDTLRDKLRLRQVYGTLISYPGTDRFAFQITENDQSHLLEFPNASTKVTKALLNQLRDMLGRDNVQVEKYLF
jgi:hypothetical protein